MNKQFEKNATENTPGSSAAGGAGNFLDDEAIHSCEAAQSHENTRSNLVPKSENGLNPGRARCAQPTKAEVSEDESMVDDHACEKLIKEDSSPSSSGRNDSKATHQRFIVINEDDWWW